jgi:hypothetical protein
MSGMIFSDLESFGQLKELYSNDVKFQEQIKSSLYNFINKDRGDVQFDGANFNVPIDLQINESYAALNDGERLPESDTFKGVFAKYKTKRMYSGIEATMFAATRGHKNGRPDGKALDKHMRGTLLSFMSNLDSDLYANGRGQRAYIATGVVGGASSFPVESSMKLRPGMKLDWYDSTLSTKKGTIQISLKGVDRMNKTVYVESSFGTGLVPSTAVAGDRLVVMNALSAGEPADGRHIAGLDFITDNVLSLGELSSSTYSAWMSTVLNASGASPSQELLQLFWDSMYTITGMYPDKMVFNPGWKRSYLSQFLNQRRFNSNTFDTGASEISFQAVKMGEDEKGKKPGQLRMLEDPKCDPTTIYLWCDANLRFVSDYADTPHLADEDGSEFRFRQGYDAISAFYRFWANTVVDQRNCIGKIYNQALPSGVL